eukprot:TRINITY_DN2651_c0_g7_i1.p1 TRINITY_DN2651_c0_g7~~TRINITY_DN2651_c0_g7_i1.p1  ORF type:complete len:863 (+),score=244.71 TRINITY_DN2651_c0_g7_i1:232-2820(+)
MSEAMGDGCSPPAAEVAAPMAAPVGEGAPSEAMGEGLLAAAKDGASPTMAAPAGDGAASVEADATPALDGGAASAARNSVADGEGPSAMQHLSSGGFEGYTLMSDRASMGSLDCIEADFTNIVSQRSSRSRGVSQYKPETTLWSMEAHEEEVGGTLERMKSKRLEEEARNKAVKEKLRQKMLLKKYDVSVYYKDSGAWQEVARSNHFGNMTLLVIVANALWIAIDTDHNKEDLLIDAHPIFQLAENLFCAFFSTEWLIRYMAFEVKRNGLRDRWFVFDGIMCAMMVLETWVFNVLTLIMLAAGDGGGGGGMQGGGGGLLRIARLLRLSRMCRVAKLLRAMPELFVMLKGLFAAARTVIFTLLLLAGLIFLFGIIFRQLTAKTELGALAFPTIFDSMYFLLVYGTLRGPSGWLATDVQASVISQTPGGGPVLTGVFFIFVLMASVLLMNMLIGVLCDVVTTTATSEKEDILISFVAEKIHKVMAVIDEDGGGTISKSEFQQILDCEEAIGALSDVGVDVIGLADCADFIFGEQDPTCDENASGGSEVELTVTEFMDVVLKLRGSNCATVKDVIEVRKFMRKQLGDVAAKLTSINQRSTFALTLVNDTTTLIKDLMRQAAAEGLLTEGILERRSLLQGAISPSINHDKALFEGAAATPRQYIQNGSQAAAEASAPADPPVAQAQSPAAEAIATASAVMELEPPSQQELEAIMALLPSSQLGAMPPASPGPGGHGPDHEVIAAMRSETPMSPSASLGKASRRGGDSIPSPVGESPNLFYDIASADGASSWSFGSVAAAVEGPEGSPGARSLVEDARRSLRVSASAAGWSPTAATAFRRSFTPVVPAVPEDDAREAAALQAELPAS